MVIKVSGCFLQIWGYASSLDCIILHSKLAYKFQWACYQRSNRKLHMSTCQQCLQQETNLALVWMTQSVSLLSSCRIREKLNSQRPSTSAFWLEHLWPPTKASTDSGQRCTKGTGLRGKHLWKKTRKLFLSRRLFQKWTHAGMIEKAFVRKKSYITWVRSQVYAEPVPKDDF